MESKSPRGFLDGFDALLESNRRQLDSLYDTSDTASPRRGSADATIEEQPASPATLDKSNLTEVIPVAWLDEHFPDAWRHEVKDRRREGNEIVVLCRLELTGLGVRKAQFGSARIEQPESGVYRNEREAESVAYDRAVDDALRQCIQYL